MLKKSCGTFLLALFISINVVTIAVAQEGQYWDPLADNPAPVQEKCPKDTSKLKAGDKCKGHEHNHEHYQQAFTTTNCKCTTGQCRATDWQHDPRSPVGIAVKFNGKWCPIEDYIDPRKVKIPKALLQDPAHSCVLDSAELDEFGCPKRSCNIINNGA